MDSFTIDGFKLGRDCGNAPPVALAWLAGVGGIDTAFVILPILYLNVLILDSIVCVYEIVTI